MTSIGKASGEINKIATQNVSMSPLGLSIDVIKAEWKVSLFLLALIKFLERLRFPKHAKSRRMCYPFSALARSGI